MKVSDLISEIQAQIHGTEKDLYVPKSLVYNKLVEVATTFTAQRLSQGRLRKNDFIYTTINCLELEHVDKANTPFGSVPLGHTLYRSVLPLPRLVNSRQGSGVQFVSDVVYGSPFNRIDINKYLRNNSRKRLGKTSDRNYFIYDGYLYVTRPSKVLVATVLTFDLLQAYMVDRCNNNNWLDAEFPLADSLLSPVISNAVRDLLSTIRALPVDENPNLDSNEKGRTA